MIIWCLSYFTIASLKMHHKNTPGEWNTCTNMLRNWTQGANIFHISLFSGPLKLVLPLHTLKGKTHFCFLAVPSRNPKINSKWFSVVRFCHHVWHKWGPMGKKKIHKCLQANSINGIKASHSGHVYSADGIRVSIQTALLNAADFSAQAGRWEC